MHSSLCHPTPKASSYFSIMFRLPVQDRLIQVKCRCKPTMDPQVQLLKVSLNCKSSELKRDIISTQFSTPNRKWWGGLGTPL